MGEYLRVRLEGVEGRLLAPRPGDPGSLVVAREGCSSGRWGERALVEVSDDLKTWVVLAEHPLPGIRRPDGTRGRGGVPWCGGSP